MASTALPDSDGQKAILTVYVSLSEICMISQYYARVLQELSIRYQGKVQFKGVFPNPFSTDSTINEFAKDRKSTFPLYRDPEGTFCKENKLSVTPEALVINRLDQVIYKGRIDDFYFAIGRFRRVTTRYDLLSALEQALKGQPVETPRVPAVGCLIDARLWERSHY